MTNEEVMATMTDMGLHEGGMDNWVMDNAWWKFASLVRMESFKEIAKKIKEMPWENDTKDSFLIWLKEQA